jgi:hypothetical protein
MLTVTRHAEERMKSRSIRPSDLAVFQEFADLETKARSGALHLRMSRKAVALAIKAGLDRNCVGRVARLNVVEYEGRILTVYRVPLPPTRAVTPNDNFVPMENAA